MAQGGTPSYTTNRRLAAAKQHEYSIVSEFTHGYRNREDVTVLPPGVMIEGSQNVLTNTFKRVGKRKGYTLDGAANTDEAPIGGDGTAMGVFDWITSAGEERNMRAGFLTSAGNDGKLQYRAVDGSGNVTWTDILTGLTSVNFNFISYFDPTNLQTVMVAVNGTSNLYVWGGGSATVASAANPTGIMGLIGNPGSDTPGRISGGKDFTVGDILTATGGGGNAKITVLTVDITENIDAAVINAGGANYVVGDQFTINGVGVNDRALCQVATLSGSAIATFTILNPGRGYGTGTNIATTTNSGVGSGATVNINTLTSGGILTWEFASDADHGTGYNASTKYTLTGGTGTLAYIWPFTVKTGSITKTGTDTWAQAGFTFQAAGTYTVLVNGMTYTYDSADFLGDTTTLYGVTPDPSSLIAGDSVVSGVRTIPNPGGTNKLPTTFENQLIATIYGFIFVGSLSESYIYISQGSTTDPYGAFPGILTTSVCPTAFINQDENLYISTGTGQWVFVKQNTSATLTNSYTISPINTAALQGARSQAFTTAIQNSIGYVSFETAVQSFGAVENILLNPQMVDLSYSIVNLMNDYDFTGGSIKYFRKFLYIAVPRENTVLIYNMTDPKNPYWEAPQILPIARFSIIGGELYGHSSQSSETYKLFTGYADRVTPSSIGYPIAADWVFSYQNYGSRFSYKKATKSYVEGYISPNATLTMKITYELDGCQTIKTFELDGADDQFVCVAESSGPLGKEPLGKVKLGGDDFDSINNLPPKFRWFPTFTNTDFFEASVSFSEVGIDDPVEILAFGLAVGGSSEIPVQNMD